MALALIRLVNSESLAATATGIRGWAGVRMRVPSFDRIVHNVV